MEFKNCNDKTKAMRIAELKKEIDDQKKQNIKLFKSIPLASHADPSNEKAESILVEWRKGSKKLKSLMKELGELEQEMRANNTNETKQNIKTFVNGFGEATQRNITCSGYERVEKRSRKAMLSFIGGR